MKESCEKQDKADEYAGKLTVFNHMNALVGELWPDMELVANVDPTGKPFDPSDQLEIETVAMCRDGKVIDVQPCTQGQDTIGIFIFDIGNLIARCTGHIRLLALEGAVLRGILKLRFLIWNKK